MNKRLKEVRKALGLTQTALGEKIGVTVTAISKMEIGERPITDRTIKALCNVFSVNRAWLEHGIGDMFFASDERSIALVENLMEGGNETARALFSALARLSAAEWATVEKLLDMVEQARGQRSSSS